MQELLTYQKILLLVIVIVGIFGIVYDQLQRDKIFPKFKRFEQYSLLFWIICVIAYFAIEICIYL